MGNFYTDNDDLRFYVEKAVDWEPLVNLVENKFRSPGGFESLDEAKEFYGEIFNMVGTFVADEIAPYSAELEKQPPVLANGEVTEPQKLTDIFSQMTELGLHGMCLPRELGGMNAPVVVYMLTSELFARADVSVMTHHGFHGGIGMAMLLYSVMEGTTEYDPETRQIIKTRFQEAMTDIAEGRAWGSMDITEPNAGSDMAALRTRAEQDAEGNWFVSGEKCFITSGHGKYHLVIARTEDATATEEQSGAGLKGLSFFLVPAFEDTPDGRKRYAKVDRIEPKIGHHLSATCTMVFDRSPAQLIGERGDGFKYMLFLMNNARLNVGFESLGLCESAHRLAESYAADRISMGKPIAQHEMIAEYLENMRTDIQGIRALMVAGSCHNELNVRAELALKLGMHESEEEKQELEMTYRRHSKHARRLTPLLKFLAAEKAVEMGRLAIQILGGVGYTKEYGAEKLLRDALVLPIYEGTSQIQSLMATKDTFSAILKNPSMLVRKLAQAKWRSVSALDPVERQAAKVRALTLSAQQTLLQKMMGQKIKGLAGGPISGWPTRLLKDWDPKRDFSLALLHAERLTELLAHDAICEILLEQSQEFPERKEVLERYVSKVLPRCQYLNNCISTTGAGLLKRLHGGETESAAEQEAS